MRLRREIAGRADDGDTERWVATATEMPKRNERAPVHWHHRLVAPVAAEARTDRRDACLVKAGQRLRREISVGLGLERDRPAVRSADGAFHPCGDDGSHRAVHMDGARGDDEQDLRFGRVAAARELVESAEGRRSQLELVLGARFANRDRPMRSDGAEDDHSRGTLSWRAMRRELPGGYELDDDPDRIDVAEVHRYLADESYWARGRPREVVEELVRTATRVIGLYHDGAQVGFARVVSDRHVVAYLADVYVLAEHRGRGLGVELVREAVERSPFSPRRWFLNTADGHDLYARFGFRPPSGEVMEKTRE